MRYYFNVKDGSYLRDEVGTEISGLEAVREQAVRSAASLMLGARRAEFWSGEDLTLHVLDEAGTEVVTLRVSAMPAPWITPV